MKATVYRWPLDELRKEYNVSPGYPLSMYKDTCIHVVELSVDGRMDGWIRHRNMEGLDIKLRLDSKEKAARNVDVCGLVGFYYHVREKRLSTVGWEPTVSTMG
jgi:hypothetical protein